MQIILASAKIMNDRSATKGDACQSKKVKSSPDISLSSPRFQNEADCFARDMIQYSVETIAEMLGRKEVRIVQPLFYVRKGSELKIRRPSFRLVWNQMVVSSLRTVARSLATLVFCHLQN